jgi:hypothetical protein
MSRRALPFVLLAVLLAAPASADAAKSQKKAIWGPVEIDGESQFRVYKDLGVGVFQMRLQWDEAATVAPENGKDPGDLAYDWPPDVETAIAEGRRNGIQVALTVTGTPGWANGERATTVAPTRPADLADFVTAAAKHFKRVHLWAIADGPVTPASRYPQMLDRAYAALHKVSAKNKVIGGNGNKRLKLSGGKAARMDYLGYDPSAKRKLTKSRLASIEKTAGTHKLWLGPTKLYTSVNGPFRMSKSAQASWLTSAFKLISSDAKVAALSYDGLLDEDGGVSHHGLIDGEGHKKPAYTAFKRAS